MADELIENAEFGRKRKNEEDPILVAQRFLNIYRQMHIFNKQRQEQFDNMLLELPPDIRILLSTLPGGSLLLEHIEELEQKRGLVSMPIKPENNFRKKNAKELLKNDSSSEKNNIRQSGGGGVVIDSSFATELSTSLSLALQQTEKRYKDDIKTLTETITQSIMESQSAIANMMKDILMASRNYPGNSDNDNASLRVLAQESVDKRPLYEEKVISPTIQNAVENVEKFATTTYTHAQSVNERSEAPSEKSSPKIDNKKEKSATSPAEQITANKSGKSSELPKKIKEDKYLSDSAKNKEIISTEQSPVSQKETFAPVTETRDHSHSMSAPNKFESDSDTLPIEKDIGQEEQKTATTTIERKEQTNKPLDIIENTNEPSKSSFNFGRISALSKDLTKRLNKGKNAKGKNTEAAFNATSMEKETKRKEKNSISQTAETLDKDQNENSPIDDNVALSLDHLLDESEDINLEINPSSFTDETTLPAAQSPRPYQNELNQIREALEEPQNIATQREENSQDQTQPYAKENLSTTDFAPTAQTSQETTSEHMWDNLSEDNTSLIDINEKNFSLDELPNAPISLDDIPDEPISLESFENDFAFTSVTDNSPSPVSGSAKTLSPQSKEKSATNQAESKDDSSSVPTAQTADEDEWEWEYIDDSDAPADDNSDDWEWEYVEEDGDDDSEDWEWEYVEDEGEDFEEDTTNIKK